MNLEINLIAIICNIDVAQLTYSFTIDDVPYQVYWTNAGVELLPTAIVLRDPPEDVSSVYFDNPNNRDDLTRRPILGVETPEGYYFSVHATSGSSTNTTNDAEALLNTIGDSQIDDSKPIFVLGDFNRNIALDNDPSGNIDAAFPNNNQYLKSPDATTISAREATPESTLDYLFTGQDLVQETGTVLNQLPDSNTANFPSDHFPVLYDDDPANSDIIIDPNNGITDNGNVNVDSTFYTFDDLSQNTVRELDPASDIDPNLPTYIITHGFTDGVGSGEQWQKAMGNSILQQEFANVVLVDWNAPGFDPNVWLSNSTFFSATNYERSARNTEVIGQRIADLVGDSNIDPSNTTLVDHSLGAQVSGWAGQKYQESQGGETISSIVGLDPARPSFQQSLDTQLFLGFAVPPVNIFGAGLFGRYKSSHQLNADDADRVAAIHTSRYFGITDPITGADGTENTNTLDIYINGGSANNSNGLLSQIDAHGYSRDFFQDLLDGGGFDDDRNQLGGSQPISNLSNPTIVSGESETELPLVSLNTLLHEGNGGGSLDINQGIYDITQETVEIEGDDTNQTLEFEGKETNDTLAGTQDNIAGDGYTVTDEINGRQGSDLISGLQGNDVLDGNDGNDTLFGGTGDDSVYGDFLVFDEAPGNDVLFGGTGNDVLFGGEGNDTLFGGIGNDELYAEEGNDRLVGVDPLSESPGVGEMDTLTGSTGTEEDVFVLGDSTTNFYVDNLEQATASYAIIQDFELGTDKIEISSNTLSFIEPIDELNLQNPPEDGGIGITSGIETASGDLTIELIAVVIPSFEDPFTVDDLANSENTFIEV